MLPMSTPSSPSPNLPPRLAFRALKPYGKRYAEALWRDRIGFPIETALELTFGDEATVHGIVLTSSSALRRRV